MSIAVVIPLFNGAPWIEETLESVRAQTRPPEEVVVVDDGSEDAGPEIVAGIPGVRLLRNPSRGSTSARRHGAGRVEGTYLAHLDQDDLWHPEHLRRLHAVLEAHGEFGAVAARTVRFRDGERPRLGAGSGSLSPLDPWTGFPARCPIRAPSVVLMRREVHDAVGGFDPDLAGIGDLVLYLTSSLERPFVSLDLATTAVREHPRSQTRALRADGIAYLALHVRGTRRALDARIENQGTTPAVQRLQARQQVLESLVGLVRAAREGRGEAAARHALDAEERLSGPRELDDVLSLVARCMVPFSGKRERRKRRFDLLEGLYDACPPDARGIRRGIVRYGSRKSLPLGALVGRSRGYALRLLARNLRPF